MLHILLHQLHLHSNILKLILIENGGIFMSKKFTF